MKAIKFLQYDSTLDFINITNNAIMHEGTVWLTTYTMSRIYGVGVLAIDKYLQDIFKSGKLCRKATVRKVQSVDSQVQEKEIMHNLELVKEVGYRIDSNTANSFYMQAMEALKLLQTDNTNPQVSLIWEEEDAYVYPTPKVLIAVTWGLIGISFLGPALGPLELLVSFGILPLGIILITNKNLTGRINGIVITILWGVTFMIGAIMGFRGVMI